MAGDWIPMRTNLEDDPTVIYIARLTKLQPDHVVGKLHRFWSWADSHTADGCIPGIDADWINGYVKKRGFAEAMAAAPQPWLTIEGDGVTIPHFSNWFGSSGKSRLMATRRQQLSRSKRDNCHGPSVTKTLLQNRTEEKSILTPALGGEDFEEVRDKAKKFTEILGPCGNQRNRRLLLGACAIALKELGFEWLETAVRETKEAQPQKPYAYLSTILASSAERLGVDFRGSIAALDLVAKRPALCFQD